MKANIKEDEVLPVEAEFNDFEDFSEEDEYAKELEAQRKPYQEVIDYIKSSPNMNEFFTNDKGETKSELDVDTLMNWEENYTNIYMSTIGDAPVLYVWRVFKRFEYLQTLGDSSKSATVDWDNDKQRQDHIVKKCLLFPNPSLHFVTNTPAGILPTLEKQILYKSGFVSDSEALNAINIIG